MNAELLAKLIASGTPPAIVAEVALELGRLEAQRDAAETVDRRSPSAIKQQRYRDRMKAGEVTKGNVVTESVTRYNESNAAPAPNKESPQTPKEINPTPRVCDVHAHEDAIGVPVSAQLAANRLAIGVLLRLLGDARERHVLNTAADCWNVMAKRSGLAGVKAMTDERRKRLRARLAEHGPDAFTEAIDAVERSSFCLGGSAGGWRADFDFLLQASSFTKLIEGSYDRASRHRGTGKTGSNGREDAIFAARRNLGRDDFAGMEPA